jgi:NADPH:quinone reductase-like Zn-dependent oxidoreductase
MSRAVTYSAYGSPSVLEISDVAEPHAGAGRVRVAVRAVGLNPYEFKVRSIPGYQPSLTFPARQGSEFAGVVDEVADDVSGVSVGDEVLGWGSGTQADFVVVAASHVAKKPRTLDWATAGGIGLVGNAAKRATDAVHLRSGETVLVSAAAGAVGLFAAQFALRVGATVIGTASERNHEFLLGLGVIPVVYGPGLVDRIRAIAPNGIDAVIDNAGEETVLAALELGVSPERINTIVWYDGAAKYGLSTVGGGKKTAAELVELARWVADGTLVMPVAATYPIADVRAAYELLESAHPLGKIVLTLP